MRRQAEKIFLRIVIFYEKSGLKSKEILIRKQAEKINFSKKNRNVSLN
jgi:hypothetical protein